jgi:hypothetical protein
MTGTSVRNPRKYTFATVVDVFTLSAWEHCHRVTSVVFIERSIHPSLYALHARESTQESRRAEAVVIIKASKLRIVLAREYGVQELITIEKLFGVCDESSSAVRRSTKGDAASQY